MFPGAVTRLQASNIKCDKISRQTHDYTVRDTQRLRWECENIPATKITPTHLWINWPRWFSVCVRGPWTAAGWRPQTPGRCWGRHSTCTWCPPWCSRLKQQTCKRFYDWLKGILDSKRRKTGPVFKRAFLSLILVRTLLKTFMNKTNEYPDKNAQPCRYLQLSISI